MPTITIRNLIFFDLGINTRGLYFDEKRQSEFQGRHLPPSEPLEKLLTLIDRFGDSVDSLELKNFHCDSGKTLLIILSRMKNLKELKIGGSLMFEYNPEDIPEDLPEITYASLTDSSEVFFNFLKNFKTLQKFKFIKDERKSENFNCSQLDELLTQIPSIKNLILEGSSTRGFFSRSQEAFTFKLTSVETDGINLSRNDGTATRLGFLKSQLGSLRDLRIKKLPFDYDGDEVLRFILEDMKLDKFYYNDVAFIKDGKKVKNIKEICFNEITIKAGMELLKQFPDVQTLKLIYSHNATSNNQGAETILQRPTNIFNNIKTLKLIIDGSENSNFWNSLIKNCDAITHLDIKNTGYEFSENIFSDCLPYLKNLQEMKLHLRSKNNQRQIFQTIKTHRFALKRIFIQQNLVEDARNILGDEVHVEPIEE